MNAASIDPHTVDRVAALIRGSAMPITFAVVVTLASGRTYSYTRLGGCACDHAIEAQEAAFEAAGWGCRVSVQAMRTPHADELPAELELEELAA